MPRTALALLLAAATAIFAAGCMAPPGPPEEPGWWTVAEEIWQETVRVSMAVRDDAGQPGVPLNVRVVIENLTPFQVEYTLMNIGDPPVRISVENPYTADLTLRTAEDREVVQPAINFETLEPNEVIERHVHWDMLIPTSTDPIVAPNGEYSLQSVFFPGRWENNEEPEAIHLTYPILIESSYEMIDAAEAEQVALQLDATQRWLEAHTGSAVARQVDGEFLVNTGGGWAPANREAYEEALQAEPQVTAVTAGHRWRLTFSSRYGFPPNDLLVVVLRTAAVHEVSPDLDRQLEGGVLAVFDVTGETYRIWVRDRETIDELFRLQSGEREGGIPNGSLRPGPGPGLHNAPWSWHIDPDGVHLADFTIELCDGWPGFVEDELGYWLDTVGQFCPWSAQLVDITDYR